MKRSHAPLVMSLLAVLGGCGSSLGVGDRYFEDGRYLEAAAAFESYLAAEPSDSERIARSMFRLGVSYAIPESPVYEPERSIEVLSRLLVIDPGGPYSTQAKLVRDLQERVLHQRRELAVRKQGIEALSIELASLQLSLAEAQSATGEGDARIDELEQRILGLQREVQRLTVEIAAREGELERLKAIDLERPP